jgi:methyltransferase (TIGR00027 family)
MHDTLIRDVSDTAFMVAAFRAMEGEREDALFHDPLSKKLAGEQGRKIVAALPGGTPRTQLMAWLMAVRTVIIDELIHTSLAEGTDAVLCLGAGLDTRPYRLDLPGSLCWIEVDFRHIIELKEGLLMGERARCLVERVQLDLGDLPARRKLLEDIGARFKRVLVLTEGVVVYLTVEAAAGLADDLTSQRTFAQWIVDYISPTTVRFSRRRGAAMRNAPFLFDPKDAFGFFKEHGWACREIRYLWDEGARLRRPLPMPGAMGALMRLSSLFMSSARRAQMRRFMGYMLLDRVNPTG